MRVKVEIGGKQGVEEVKHDIIFNAPGVEFITAERINGKRVDVILEGERSALTELLEWWGYDDQEFNEIFAVIEDDGEQFWGLLCDVLTGTPA